MSFAMVTCSLTGQQLQYWESGASERIEAEVFWPFGVDGEVLLSLRATNGISFETKLEFWRFECLVVFVLNNTCVIRCIVTINARDD